MKLICTLRLSVSAKSGGRVGRFFLQIRSSIYAKSARSCAVFETRSLFYGQIACYTANVDRANVAQTQSIMCSLKL